MSTEIDDFANSIGRQIHSYSRAGLMTADEWTLISRAYLDHLGTIPLSTPEAEAVLADAAEAAAAAVSFTAYYPHERFHVFLDHVNFGMSYDLAAEADPAPISARRWIDALCLAILTDTFDRHGEAFYFTWEGMPEPDDLATGLLSQVADDDEIELPADTAASPGLQALHALDAGDRPAFDAALAALLHHTVDPLPLLPLALSALAYRAHQWLPSPDNSRLPHALVTNS
ncbi:hypothetical protein [Streptomyces sp. CBMA123]|uniref:hypothetical protein n=1 Tax=Streptomyces sp. CBMA123 TaxID=1896313 RepID=UPI001661A42C|nr:hypothetical protein [Streptomyces sp. CBMA123]MBD0692509.1 hypothetical protein [Streptomyces sp. CBMA123]